MVSVDPIGIDPVDEKKPQPGDVVVDGKPLDVKPEIADIQAALEVLPEFSGKRQVPDFSKAIFIAMGTDEQKASLVSGKTEFALPDFTVNGGFGYDENGVIVHIFVDLTKE